MEAGFVTGKESNGGRMMIDGRISGELAGLHYFLFLFSFLFIALWTMAFDLAILPILDDLSFLLLAEICLAWLMTRLYGIEDCGAL
jgi:hypothetical protein